MNSVAPEVVSILGVPVHKVTMTGALSYVEELVSSGGAHQVITLGTEMVMDAQTNRRFRDVIRSASLVVPDGGGLLWASRRLNHPLPEKVAGIELLERLCELSQDKVWKIFLLGSQPGVAEEAARKLLEKYPRLLIAGIHHGYFQESEIVSMLKSAKPQILFAGLGSPRQELWLQEHLSLLGISLGMGVGGSFDVLAGRLKRAPRWMRALNLEWLFRFFQEPRRLQRILKIPIFMGKIYFKQDHK